VFRKKETKNCFRVSRKEERKDCYFLNATVNRPEMKIKTLSGICIDITNSSSSRLLFFDKPVRAIELTKDESFQVGTLLNDGTNTKGKMAIDPEKHMKSEASEEHDCPEILTSVETEARKFMEEHHFTGHDFAHVLRVQKLCKAIGEKENANMLVLLASALLHDLGRDYERKNPAIDHAKKSADIAKEILCKVGFPEEKIPSTLYAIAVHRFRKGVTPTTLEARILQDADRIDISGAVGIATTFAFGGVHNSEMYNSGDPFAENRNLDDSSYVLDHFYTKLLNLPETMHTTTGREIAERRRGFMQHFLEEFRTEIEGGK
jgi:uncharacterized protein